MCRCVFIYMHSTRHTDLDTQQKSTSVKMSKNTHMSFMTTMSLWTCDMHTNLHNWEKCVNYTNFCKPLSVHRLLLPFHILFLVKALPIILVM